MKLVVPILPGDMAQSYISHKRLMIIETVIASPLLNRLLSYISHKRLMVIETTLRTETAWTIACCISCFKLMIIERNMTTSLLRLVQRVSFTNQ